MKVSDECLIFPNEYMVRSELVGNKYSTFIPLVEKLNLEHQRDLISALIIDGNQQVNIYCKLQLNE